MSMTITDLSRLQANQGGVKCVLLAASSAAMPTNFKPNDVFVLLDAMSTICRARRLHGPKMLARLQLVQSGELLTVVSLSTRQGNELRINSSPAS